MGRELAMDQGGWATSPVGPILAAIEGARKSASHLLPQLPLGAPRIAVWDQGGQLEREGKA